MHSDSSVAPELEWRLQVQIGLREKLFQFFPTNPYMTDAKS